MSISMAMIAFGPKTHLSGSAIRAELSKRWPDLPKAKAAEKTDDSFSFRVGSLDVVAGLMPAPIPWSDLEGACANSVLWKDAAVVLHRHSTHLILTVSGSDQPLERIRLLTQVTGAILATCKQAVGVFWTTSGMVIQPSLFLDVATESLPKSDPLEIWIDFRIGKSESGKTIGFTRGMESLGHMEFETEESTEPASELRDRFLGLAQYLLEHGPVIRDGDTFGESNAERIKIVYDESRFGHDKEVMRLEYIPIDRPRRRRRRRRSSGKKRSRSKMTPYGYIHAAMTVGMTIALGFLLHWLLSDLVPWFILRHVLLDIPLVIFGFVFLVVSDSILQKAFGLEAFRKIEFDDNDDD